MATKTKRKVKRSAVQRTKARKSAAKTRSKRTGTTAKTYSKSQIKFSKSKCSSYGKSLAKNKSRSAASGLSYCSWNY